MRSTPYRCRPAATPVPAPRAKPTLGVVVVVEVDTLIRSFSVPLQPWTIRPLASLELELERVRKATILRAVQEEHGHARVAHDAVHHELDGLVRARLHQQSDDGGGVGRVQHESDDAAIFTAGGLSVARPSFWV